MGKESGTQFLKALKDAIGESAIDGEARNEIKKETAARIAADAELEEQIKSAGKVDYLDWEVSGLPDGLELAYCHMLGPEFQSAICLRFDDTGTVEPGMYTVTLKREGYSPVLYGCALALEVFATSYVDYKCDGFNFEQKLDPPSAEISFTLLWNPAHAAGSPFYVRIETLVNGMNIAEGAIDTDQLYDGCVTEDKIWNSSVTEDKIHSDAVSTDAIIDAAVTSDKIADAAVTSDKIADAAVTNAKIGRQAVTGDKIMHSTITATQLSDRCVDHYILGKNAVENDNIHDTAVTTAKLADTAVTTAKLADNCVGTDQLGYGVVTKAKMAESSVGEQELADGSVTKSKLATTLRPYYGSFAVNVASGATQEVSVTTGTTNVGSYDTWTYFFNFTPDANTSDETKLVHLTACCTGINTSDNTFKCYVHNSGEETVNCMGLLFTVPRAAFN